MGEEPLVRTAAAVFQDLCYSYRDQLTAGIICAGWDKKKGGQVPYSSVWLFAFQNFCIDFRVRVGFDLFGAATAEYENNSALKSRDEILSCFVSRCSRFPSAECCANSLSPSEDPEAHICTVSLTPPTRKA